MTTPSNSTISPNTSAAALLSLPLDITADQRRALEAMAERNVTWVHLRLADVSALGIVEQPFVASLILDYYGVETSESLPQTA